MFFLLDVFFSIFKSLGSGYLRLMNYQTEYEAMWYNVRGANWRSLKVIFVSGFEFCLLHSPCNHFEKFWWWNILRMNWPFLMVSAEKVPESLDFGHLCGVDFASSCNRSASWPWDMSQAAKIMIYTVSTA